MKRLLGSLPLFVALLAIGLLAGACSSDSPTRPTQQAAPPPGTTPTTATFAISIVTDRPELVIGSNEAATLTISVRRTDNNQVPPNGTTVTLSTTLGDFQSAGSGTRSIILQLTNGIGSIQLFAADIAGNANIQATIQNSSGRLSIPIVGSLTFAASFVEPSSGAPGGGDTVVVQGQGFVSPVKVEFLVEDNQGSSNTTTFVNTAQVVAVTPEAVTLVTPPSPVSVGVGQTVTVDVRITNKLGSQEQTIQVLEGSFLYALGGSLLQPAVTSLSPASGPNEGGISTRILGDGFEAPVQVLFGSGSGDNFQGIEAVVQSVNRNEILVTVPAATGFGLDNRNSFVDVLVRNKVSGFFTVSGSAFKYGLTEGPFISTISPNQGSHLGGTTVTLFGGGFDEPVSVSLAGLGADIISVTGSEVVVRSNGIQVDSCQDISGGTELTNIETGDTATGQTYIYRVPEPIITAVSPPSLPDFGGTIGITGLNFESPLRVLVDDKVVQILDFDGSTITVTVPPFTAFNTQTCDDNNDGTEGERLVPTSVDIDVINLLTTCDDMLMDALTFNPPDSICRGDVGTTLPVASFTFEVVDASDPGAIVVAFTNTSTGATSYEWDFENDGTVDTTEENPTVSLPAGSYSVKLTATGAGGSAMVVNLITIP